MTRVILNSFQDLHDNKNQLFHKPFRGFNDHLDGSNQVNPVIRRIKVQTIQNEVTVMPIIQIEKDDLATAMTGSMDNMCWFLDKQTGEIFNLFVPSYYDMGGMENPDAELWDKVEENEGDRYEKVIICESSEAFHIMENFVDSLSDLKAQRDLYKALSQRRPFANFKNALYEYPDLREQWFRFHDDALADQAKDWLDSLGVDYEIIDTRKH